MLYVYTHYTRTIHAPPLTVHAQLKSQVVASNELPFAPHHIVKRTTAHVAMSWSRSSPVMVYHLDFSKPAPPPAKPLNLQQQQMLQDRNQRAGQAP